MAAWLYIMTNRRDGTLYIGVTTALAARAWQHRTGVVPGFTKKYGLTRLVYVETHDTISEAIRRERTLKTWRRAWKVRLITEANPNWGRLVRHPARIVEMTPIPSWSDLVRPSSLGRSETLAGKLVDGRAKHDHDDRGSRCVTRALRSAYPASNPFSTLTVFTPSASTA